MSSTQTAVGITPLETRRDVVLHLAKHAENLGYTAFYVGEAWGHDASVLLAELALNTSRIGLGTGVLNVWGRSAASIAMLAAGLAELSGDRFELGLGPGTPQLAEGLHDIAFRAPVERLGRIIRQARRLLAGERLEPALPGGSRPLKLGVVPSAEVRINVAALGPQAVRLCGELADGWYPFLLPQAGLKDGRQMLEEGAARNEPRRPLPRICPGIPVAMAPDPVNARDVASWWVTFYLLSMGTFYGRALRSAGLGTAVDAVLEANPTGRGAEVPAEAQVLLDELTIWGDESRGQAALDSWRAAGADMPVLVLPPGRTVKELEYALDVLRPSGR